MKPFACRALSWLALALSAVLLLGGCTSGTADPADTTAATTEAPTDPVTEAPTPAPTEAPTEPETEPAPLVYYVCTDPADPEGTSFRKADDLETAISYCERKKQEGYRVVTSRGETVYLPYTELQCDILRECKEVTDYCRENGFKYGDAPTNPAMNHRAKKVSCDRFVAWALYNVGFTDQPRTQGVVVSAMAAWCEKNGFERIDNQADLQPGDVVLVKFNGSWPAHTFIYAGETRIEGQPYRYDCGSDSRIQSVQPSTEPIIEFWRAYRAVADSPHRETGDFATTP